jgi:hypothetical protein
MEVQIKFMMRTAHYTHLDYEKSADIMKELDTQPVTAYFKVPAQRNWKTRNIS